MFGANDLKSEIKPLDNHVVCPVKDCKKIVPRQKRVFRSSKDFFCSEHKIYVSPSTFEYQNYTDTLLWKDKADLELLRRIALVKRENRIARDNSEDAVTWNVFRFLEKQNLLPKYLSTFSNNEEKNPEINYWSYSQTEDAAWSKLVRARKEFERYPAKGSEPDLIIKSDTTLFFIEAKFNSSNNTVPRSKDPLVKQKYVTGGSSWYQSVFKSEFEDLASKYKKYELLRFWLLGSWMAHAQNLNFIMVNLVPSEREKDIEAQFKKHVFEGNDRTFCRGTWEGIYRFIQEEETVAEVPKEWFLDILKTKL
jgi:hypothetical protein